MDSKLLGKINSLQIKRPSRTQLSKWSFFFYAWMIKKLFNKQKQKPVSKVHLHGTTTPRSHFTTRPIRANSTQSKCYEFWVRHFSVNAAQMHTVARCVLCYLRIARLHRNDREKTNDKFVHA